MNTWGLLQSVKPEASLTLQETQSIHNSMNIPKIEFYYLQSNLSYPNVDYQKLLGYSKTMDSPDFFPYYLLQ